MKTGEYKELSKIKNNYRCVIGVSKLFNPEFSKDRSGKSNAALLAKLPLYHRTPAYMFQHERENGLTSVIINIAFGMSGLETQTYRKSLCRYSKNRKNINHRE